MDKKKLEVAENQMEGEKVGSETSGRYNPTRGFQNV